VPKYTLEKGDPYVCLCSKTGRLLAEALELGEDDWTMSFQSRVGREEWLRPYTDETVVELAERGIERLDVACPGFSTDCLETLEEIAMQNAGFFTAAGGTSLQYIPALNARDDHVALHDDLIARHTAGWEVS
jgi:ferrochelatase